MMCFPNDIANLIARLTRAEDATWIDIGTTITRAVDMKDLRCRFVVS